MIQLELAIQEKRALFEEKREQSELCNSLRIEVSDLQRELEERGSGGKRNDKQTKQMQQTISVAEERAEQAEKQVKELTAALKKAKKSHLGSKSPVSGSDVVISECEQCIEHTNVEAQLREDVADLESALKAAQELLASERERADTAEQQAARVQDLERLVRKMRAANVKGAIDSSATDEVAAQQLPLRSNSTLVIASNAPKGCCSVS
jgi:chromosome segregation ATPase